MQFLFTAISAGLRDFRSPSFCNIESTCCRRSSSSLRFGGLPASTPKSYLCKIQISLVFQKLPQAKLSRFHARFFFLFGSSGGCERKRSGGRFWNEAKEDDESQMENRGGGDSGGEDAWKANQTAGRKEVKEGRFAGAKEGFGEGGKMMLMFAYYSSSNFPPGAH